MNSFATIKAYMKELDCAISSCNNQIDNFPVKEDTKSEIFKSFGKIEGLQYAKELLQKIITEPQSGLQ